MSAEKIILPEDVVLKVSDRTIWEYRDHNGRTFLTADEYAARYNECTHVHCSTKGCAGIAQKGHAFCPACALQKRRARISSLPAWDETYPVFAGDDFIDDEDALLDYLEEHEIDDLELLELWEAKPNMASDINVDYDDLLAEDCDLPRDVQQIVDEFYAKLKEVKTPLSYVPGKPIRMSDEKISYYNERDESMRGE